MWQMEGELVRSQSQNKLLDQKGSPYLNACRKEVVQFDPPIAKIATVIAWESRMAIKSAIGM